MHSAHHVGALGMRCVSHAKAVARSYAKQYAAIRNNTDCDIPSVVLQYRQYRSAASPQLYLPTLRQTILYLQTMHSYVLYPVNFRPVRIRGCLQIFSTMLQ